MRITPLDIRKQPFRKSMMGGFDKDAVNSFLEMVANEYEQVLRKSDEAAMTIKTLEERLAGYEKIERVLNETLLTAQRATDEAKLNAQKEAELIIKDAQIRADRYEDKSRDKVNTLATELVSLRTQRDSFLSRFKSLLRDQLSLVDVLGDTLKDDSDNSESRESHEVMGEVPDQPIV
jgi:cell division initiation protein